MTTCEVCGARLTGSRWALPDGRSWCARHPRRPACEHCGLPLGDGLRPACRSCRDSAVRTVADMRPYKGALLQHMGRVGIVLPAPTRILLAKEGKVFPPAGGGRAHLGDTTWAHTADGITGTVTVRIAGGLPGHRFQRTLAHEFGHAAMAGGTPAATLSSPLREGFAECVAAAHLAVVGTVLALDQLRQLEANPDPIYGGGYRWVREAVDRHGLVAVCAALRDGRPDQVGLHRSAHRDLAPRDLTHGRRGPS